MNSNLIVLSCFLTTFAISQVQGCHDYHHRRKRQAFFDDSMNIEETRYLRNFFSECMQRRANQAFPSWDSVLDFTILDTNWYQNTDTSECSASLNLDTNECWKERLNDYLVPDSPLLPLARDCIDEYTADFAPNCTGGSWTQFFNLDNPSSGEGDFEIFQDVLRESPNLVCPNPSAVDPRLSNGEDYRITGQTVRVGTDHGFSCNNSQQIQGICEDYMVRYCCPFGQGSGSGIQQPFIRVTRSVSAELRRLFRSTNQEEQDYISCLSGEIILPPNRRDLDIESVLEFVQGHLLCFNSTVNGSDCYINVNGTANLTITEFLASDAWPYIFQGVTKPESSLALPITDCNEAIFPVNLVIERIVHTRSIGWSEWGPWGHCPSRCGERGERNRRRTCIGGPPRRYPCLGPTDDSEVCVPAHCGGSGSNGRQPHWSVWGQWTGCSSNQQNPFQTRRRMCNFGSPGQTGCFGSDSERQQCGSVVIDQNANLSQWSTVTACQGSCGNQRGFEQRRRTCLTGTNDSPGCAGPYDETRACTRSNCPFWGVWSQFSSCSVNCGSGIRTRYRQCTNGRVGDVGCQGGDSNTQHCFAGSCGGGWNAWNSWEHCSAQCNQVATQFRRRTCSSGGPGSNSCPGSDVDTRDCTKTCGTWSNWTAYTPCVGCGHSTQSRSRICQGGVINQPNCYGNNFESRGCYTGRPC